jgi:hypothetical protein
MPTPTEIRTALEKILQQIQAAGGRPCPVISDSTKPIGDLEDFDSLLGVEATVLLEQELGCTLAAGTPFMSAKSSPRALTVAEIVVRVAEMIVPARAA